MKYEYSAIEASTYPSPDELQQFGDEGWLVVQMIERDDKILIYLVRGAKSEGE